MNKLEITLKQEWENDKSLRRYYDGEEDYISFMTETIHQYIQLKKEIEAYQGTLDDYKETLEFGFNNYEENEYLDFNYGNLTVTVNVCDEKLVLSEMVEIWNDRTYSLIYAPFDITEYLIVMEE